MSSVLRPIGLSLSCFFLFTHISIASVARSTLTANEIVRRADERRMPAAPLAFTAEVKDFQGREVTGETRYQVLSRGHDAGLVETVFPERQQGRKILMEGDNLWLYTKDTRRPARVSMQQKLAGEIANGDLARTDFHGDYDAELLGKEKLDGKTECYRLRLKAKREGVTYSRIDYWVNAKSFFPVKAVFYAVSGKALKQGFYGDPKTILGRKVITKLKVTDILDPQRSSVLTYMDHKRQRLPASLFNKEAMND